MNLHTNDAQRQGFRQSIPLLSGPVRRASRAFPNNQTLVFADAFAMSQLDFPGYMRAHNLINTMLFAKSQIAVGGKDAIGKKHLAAFEQGKDSSQQRAFVLVKFRDDPMKQRARVKTKTGDHLHNRKAATGPLHGWLRKSGLIHGRIRQTNPRSIDRSEE